ncbi:MAG: alpha-glucosidase, partial [Clostridia bacterium]|nr:alpha-glucosidase [Clostridia bacterium]
VYVSPVRGNGYDISYYKGIDPCFGTMEDLERLIAAAHGANMRMMMDIVANHTSSEHPWFLQSRASRDNPYRDFYIWRDGKNGGPPTNWGSIFSGPAWTPDAATGQYYMHSFLPEQPDLNWENPAVREAVFDIMLWWREKGIDGFRLDGINMISKDQRFLDGEMGALYGNGFPYMYNGPRIHAYMRELNSRVFRPYDMLSVGETSHVSVEDGRRYTGEERGELSMIFQFMHVDGGPRLADKWTDRPFPFPELRRIFNSWQTGLAGIGWNGLYWSNHDQPRPVSRFGNDGPLYRAVCAKMLGTCLHMLQGTPYIFQGEELGMTNAYFQHLSDYRDRESIDAFAEYTEGGLLTEAEMLRCLQVIGRDNARTPMQWSAKPNAGFTAGEPWIRVNPNYLTINVENQIQDPCSVFHYYRRLIMLRKAYPIIVHGDFTPLLEENPSVYAYERRLRRERLLVLCSFAAQDTPCELGWEPGARELLSNYPSHKNGLLQPYEARVLLYEEG